MKNKKIPTIKVGTNKLYIRTLWAILITSLLFAIYKNFTAIDKHTVHERETVYQEIIDTNNIESFTGDFIRVFYSWEQTKESIDKRTELLNNFMTDELVTLNSQTIRVDIPNPSSVGSYNIWSVREIDKNNFEVIYSVNQILDTQKSSNVIESTFYVIVHIDDSKNLVITTNPTATSKPLKSSYQEKAIQTDGSVDASTIEEIDEFLKSFFTMYPSATEKEIAYYVDNNLLNQINKNYVFVELINSIYIQKEDTVLTSFYVKYIDRDTNSIIIMEYNLELTKSGNWKIKKVLK